MALVESSSNHSSVSMLFTTSKQYFNARWVVEFLRIGDEWRYGEMLLDMGVDAYRANAMKWISGTETALMWKSQSIESY